ncbi:hypothetical protein BGZ63DRAFT_452126 [Mariannaea sp. PMI_226]|nr:hypothetical protein BGZ63DRAFT_452126 [Mariannaea sp. PMI_226]
MATTPRFGSMMLSRLSVPSTSRAFSTSIALRAGSSQSGASTPARTNPLVGNRTFNREPQQKPASDAQSTVPQPTSQPRTVSKTPPPPPPSSYLLSGIAPNSETDNKPQHPYTATASPSKTIDLASIIANKSMNFSQGLDAAKAARPQIRAKAVAGRTVFIKDRISPTSAPTPTVALRVLNKMVREQQVKTKFHSQRFHERKGLKRKRLASQRWRSRFKSGFKATVNRVLELKRQGW